MKKNIKRNGNGNGKRNGHAPRTIRIEFTHPTAETVAIAGTFNDWKPQTTRMVALEAGRWLKELALPPGRYEYLIVADGQWLPDPAARETAPNPYGGVNSVVTVESPADDYCV